jgi:hypothetical protein
MHWIDRAYVGAVSAPTTEVAVISCASECVKTLRQRRSMECAINLLPVPYARLLVRTAS